MLDKEQELDLPYPKESDASLNKTSPQPSTPVEASQTDSVQPKVTFSRTCSLFLYVKHICLVYSVAIDKTSFDMTVNYTYAVFITKCSTVC